MKKSIVLIICILSVLLNLVGCSKEVVVNASGLTNITLNGELVANTGNEYSASLVADEYHTLPKKISVLIDGIKVTEGFTYDSTTGDIVIDKETVTGNISFVAEAKETVIGNWTGEVDYTETLNETIKLLDPELGKVLTFSDIKMSFMVSFNKEGIYSFKTDDSAIDEIEELLKVQLNKGYNDYIASVLQSQGLDMSVDVFLSDYMDTSIDEMVLEAIENMDLEEDFKVDKEGNYKIEGNKLFYTEDKNSEFDENIYNEFTVENGNLTLDDLSMFNNQTGIKSTLVLKRAEDSAKDA